MPAVAEHVIVRKRPQLNSEIESLWLSGWMISDIADKLKIGKDLDEGIKIVTSRLEGLGYNAQRYSWSEDNADTWAAMYDGTLDGEFYSIAEIARYAEFSQGTVLRGILIRGGKIRHVKLALKYSHEKRKRLKEAGAKSKTKDVGPKSKSKSKNRVLH